MPTKDAAENKIWTDKEAQGVLANKRYVQHFAELVTRRLRFELRPERIFEPQYSHTLDGVERAAHYFVSSALVTEGTEARAYFHEAAALFEQIAAIGLHKKVAFGPDGRFLEHQSIMAALSYYLAGYEANAITIANQFLMTVPQKTRGVCQEIAALFLAKRLGELREALFKRWSAKPPEFGERPLGDSVLEAADRATMAAAGRFMEALRRGADADFDGANSILLTAARGYDSCSEPISGVTARLLARCWASMRSRSIYPLLQQSGFDQETWSDYARLLVAGRRPITEIWRSQTIPSQYSLLREDSIVVSIPTSAGKTLIAELAILRALLTSPIKKIVYLVPTRALASEIEVGLAKRFGALGYKVSALFGGYELSDFERLVIEECRILVATPEKCDLLIRSVDGFSDSLSLVICDEAHQVASGDRGLRYEMLLTRLLARAGNTPIRLVMLSAVLPNTEMIASWLGTTLSVSDQWKPTRTRLAHFSWQESSGHINFLDADLRVGAREAFVPNVVDKRTAGKTREAWIANLAMHFVKIGTTMVFSPRPKRCEELAGRIKNVIKRRRSNLLSGSATAALKRHLRAIKSILGDDHDLVACLEQGVAFHHGRLPHSVRVRIEELVRSGVIPLVVATETLAQGVNLGIRNIIIDSVSRGGADNLISIRDFWNIVGRAGRAGKEVEGLILFIPDKEGDFKKYLLRYLDPQKMETTRSVLISTLCEALVPRSFEVWERVRASATYMNVWSVIIDMVCESAKSAFELADPALLKSELEAAFAPKLVPTYRWNRDTDYWADSLREALRTIFMKGITFPHGISFDQAGWRKLIAALDSQILAAIIEGILTDEANSEETFLARTLLGAELGPQHPLFSAFAAGVHKRKVYVTSRVKTVAEGRLFNSTGLSVDGNRFIADNIDALLEILTRWRDGASDGVNFNAKVLEIANGIPDLLPAPDARAREAALLSDWIAGRGYPEIAEKYFEADLENTVRYIETEIVRKLPWGISSIFQHLGHAGLNVADLPAAVKNLPGMVFHGLPNPVAIFTAFHGVDNRADCQKIADLFAKESGKSERFVEFTNWFCGLWKRKDSLDRKAFVGIDFESLLALSEARGRGYQGVPQKVFIQFKAENFPPAGNEVLLFPDSEGNTVTLADMKSNSLGRWTFKTPTIPDWFRQKDYVAKVGEDQFGIGLDVKFI